ncbi:hypothetical protein D3C80_1929030 [compost metagenome]
MHFVSAYFCSDDHFLGVGQGFLGQVDATEHPCHFFYPLVLAQARHCRTGSITAAYFVHEQVVVPLGGYLGQVRDGQYLAALAKPA